VKSCFIQNSTSPKTELPTFGSRTAFGTELLKRNQPFCVPVRHFWALRTERVVLRSGVFRISGTRLKCVQRVERIYYKRHCHLLDAETNTANQLRLTPTHAKQNSPRGLSLLAPHRHCLPRHGHSPRPASYPPLCISTTAGPFGSNHI
jgi:hypothetical protein